MSARGILFVSIAAFAIGCGGPAAQGPVHGAPTSTATTPPAPSGPDPLGPPPAVPAPPPYAPPVPTVFTTANGMTVWLVERHTLPMVSMALAVRAGSVNDPADKPGLAYETANMVDEGAGKLGALELATAVDALGASLGTSADLDASFVSMTVLKRNLSQAMTLFGDVVVRPRFLPEEWKRVSDLWKNDLKERASDPDETARVVWRRALYGDASPLAHPPDGTPIGSKNVTLDDVKRFYAAAWRPESATLAVVGDVTQAELAPLLEGALGSWKGGAQKLPALPPNLGPSEKRPRTVFVDRPGAPQSVIVVAMPGIAAADPDLAPLARANTAIGGGFTSRLNQDLREEHHWSYGAGSSVAFTRAPSQVLALSDVDADHTNEALRAMLADLATFAKSGLTDEEAAKTRALARSDLILRFERVDGAAIRFGKDASLGLPPDFEAKTALARDAAQKPALDALAAKYYDASKGLVLVVGPKDKVDFGQAGLPAPEVRDAEGNVLK